MPWKYKKDNALQPEKSKREHAGITRDQRKEEEPAKYLQIGNSNLPSLLLTCLGDDTNLQPLIPVKKRFHQYFTIGTQRLISTLFYKVMVQKAGTSAK